MSEKDRKKIDTVTTERDKEKQKQNRLIQSKEEGWKFCASW